MTREFELFVECCAVACSSSAAQVMPTRRCLLYQFRRRSVIRQHAPLGVVRDVSKGAEMSDEVLAICARSSFRYSCSPKAVVEKALVDIEAWLEDGVADK